MITIDQQPYQCSYSKNNIDFVVSSNLYFESIKVLPTVTFTVVSFPLIGVHYYFEYHDPESGEKKELRLVADPNYLGKDEIPDDDFVGTIEQYRDIVVGKLKELCPANGWYDVIAISTNALQIIARKEFEDLIPTFFSNQTFAHFNISVDTAMIDPIIRKGYRMNALVFFEGQFGSGDFEMVSNIPCVLNENAQYNLDVSDILNAETEQTWDEYPVPTDQDLFYISPNLKRYYVEFVETWTGETTKYSTKSDVRFVHWGGVSTDDENIASPILLNSLKNDFLTWWPSGKRISIDQEDWLSWMNQYEFDNFEIYIDIITNVTTHTSNLHIVELEEWQSVVFQSGFTQNDLQSLVPGGEVINKWDFYVKNGSGEQVSPKYRYYPERTNCFRRILMYFNSFGMPETFNTSGDFEIQMKIDRQLASRSSGFNLSQLMPRSFVFSSNYQHSLKAVTSPLSKLEAYRLQPLINSTISFLKEDNKWIPMLMASKKADVYKENVFLRRIGFDAVKANDSDRTSFHELIPDIEVVKDCGIDRFIIKDNNTNLVVFGNLSVYKDGVLEQNIVYNIVEKAYIATPKITANSTYRLEVTLSGVTLQYPLNKHFEYKKDQITAHNSQLGVVSIGIRSADLANSIDINWGDGSGFVTENYTDSVTLIQHNYTNEGKKLIRFEKACFDDILEIGAGNTDWIDFDFSGMKNLEKISFIDSLQGNVYLSANTKLQHIQIFSSPVTSIKLGFLRDLTILTTDNISLTSDSLDDLFLELWEYREHYNNVPQIFTLSLGFTESALVTSIVDGTGIYAGEGLVTNYGWSVTIS